MLTRCMIRLRGAKSWPTKQSLTVRKSSKAYSWRKLSSTMEASASYSNGSKQLSQAEKSTLRGARLPQDAPKKTARRRSRRRRTESNVVKKPSSRIPRGYSPLSPKGSLRREDYLVDTKLAWEEENKEAIEKYTKYVDRKRRIEEG